MFLSDFYLILNLIFSYRFLRGACFRLTSYVYFCYVRGERAGTE